MKKVSLFFLLFFFSLSFHSAHSTNVSFLAECLLEKVRPLMKGKEGREESFYSHFSIQPKYNLEQSFNGVINLIQKWAQQHLEAQLDPVKFKEGAQWSKENGTMLMVTSISDELDKAVPEHWALRLEHPCRSCPGRIWRVDIVVNRGEGKLDTFFTVSYNEVSAGIRPENSVPRIVRDITSNTVVWTAVNSKMPVGYSAVTLKPQEGASFLALLQDPERTLPVIFVSRTSFDGRFLTDPEVLAKKFAGRALVVVEGVSQERIDGIPGIQSELLNLGLGRLKTYNGAVRVFLPGLSLDDPFPHRLYTPQLIEEKLRSVHTLADAINRNIVSAPKKLHQLDTILEILEIKRARELKAIEEEVRVQRELITETGKLIDDQSSTSEELKSALDKIRVLEGRLEQKASQVASLEEEMIRLRKITNEELSIYEQVSVETAEKNKELQKEINKKDKKINELIRDAHSQRKKGTVVKSSSEVVKLSKIVRELITSPDDAYKVVRVLYEDRLLFTERALKTIQKYNKVLNGKTVYDMLVAAATDVYSSRFIGESKLPPDHLKVGDTTMEISFSENKSTSWHPDSIKERKDFYFRETPGSGKREKIDIEAWPHIKAKVAGQFYRIYFEYDPEGKKVIISAVVDHFTTSGSQRRGY